MISTDLGEFKGPKYVYLSNRLGVLILQGGHFVFMDNPESFHAAVVYACRKYFATGPDDPVNNLPEGLIIPPRLATERIAESGPNVR